MLIQYASDLHIEFTENKNFLKQNPIKPIGDILVMAGDIVPFAIMDKHKDFFNYLSDNFSATYWLPGNHEYYHFDIQKEKSSLNESIRSNVFLVNNTTKKYDNIKLIFSTLWSKISSGYQWQIERGMNDFRLIKYNGYRFSAERYNLLHEQSLSFICNELTNTKEDKIAVFTHHCPTFFNYPDQYKNSILNEAFAVELYGIIEKYPINYWGYGHIHSNTPEFYIGNTKLITNQLGYVAHYEHTTFKTDRCFKL